MIKYERKKRKYQEVKIENYFAPVKHKKFKSSSEDVYESQYCSEIYDPKIEIKKETNTNLTILLNRCKYYYSVLLMKIFTCKNYYNDRSNE